MLLQASYFFFFFNDTATTEIYTLSLHDALPISLQDGGDELLPNGLGGLGLDTLHVIPEMLGSQLRRRSRGPNARQGRAGNPIPHRLFADRFASAVDRGQTDVITGAQPLGALRA